MRIATASILLFILITSCSDSREYKIKFDRVEKLTEGDEIFILGVDVGKVEDVTVDKDNKVLVTISITKDIKVTEGSKFILQSDVIGHQEIEIELANMDNELIEPGRLQAGEIRRGDTTGFRKITQEELDSIIKVDPGWKLADKIIKILRKIQEEKKTTGR